MTLYKGLSARLLAIALGVLVALPLLGVDAALAAPARKGPPRAIRENVAPYTGIPANIPPAITFRYPSPPATQKMWIGALANDCNLRYGPGAEYGVDRSWQKGRRILVHQTLTATTGADWHKVMTYPDPELYIWSGCVSYVAPLQLPGQKHSGKWVDVNLTQQVVIAMEGARPMMVGQVASGKKGHETNAGTWRIYWRLQKQDMDGGGTPDDPYYNLKDVPWVQYFNMNEHEGLHGTYWHDNFGAPASHGCVNMSYGNSNWLYLWANVGTPVVVHH